MNENTERRVREATEEDLTTGPTPETRRADGELPSDRDTSDAPTPETRDADHRADRSPT